MEQQELGKDDKTKPDSNGGKAEDFVWTDEEFWSKLKIGKSLFYRMKSDGRLGPMPLKIGDSHRADRWNPKEAKAWRDYGGPNREKWQEIWKRIREGKN